jgi:uncharacterized RDD family membrane protein YckC
MSVEPARVRTETAQAEAIRRLRGSGETLPATVQDGAPAYAGLVTRTIALALDAIVIDGIALIFGVTVGLGLSILHLPSEVDAIVAAVMGLLAVLWTVGYFVFFWSSTGQTLGSRVMSIAVIDAYGRGSLKPRRALLRFVALCLGAIALLAGLWIMLWDRRRRCFQDRVARTVVVYMPEEEPLAPPRAPRRL